MHRLLAAAVLLVLMALLPAVAHAQSCTTSAQPLAFGIIGSPTAQVDTAANITLNCTGTAGNTVRVCLGINAGVSVPASTVANRRMGNGSNSVTYQIAQTAFGGVNWGDYSGGAPGQEVGVLIAAGGSGNATVSMYGRIANGQNVPVGAYTSSLTVTARNPNGNSPCVNNTGSFFTPASFTATVNTGGSCTITATPVNFGSASSLAAVINANGALAVTCTTNLKYSIALNAGSTTGNTIAARKMSLNGVGAGVVSYQLYRDPGPANIWGNGASGVVYTGNGAGVAQTLPVYGQVPVQATPAGGTYRDTVVATVTY